ncbi:glycosyltransferase [Roseococcus sp. YIM B11640]|uniref:glycosyltransferase n=1 Tax=Roseococcus sp. YIM B11640 TaxID=3133973 RepID=UPI003C79DD19
MADGLRLVADVTDLLDFFEGNRTPMGIARVQTAILEAGLAEGAPPLFELAAYSFAQSRFVAYPLELLRRMIAGARRGGEQDGEDWMALRAESRAVQAEAPPFAFAEGDRVVALGLTGADPGQLRRLRELRASHGIQLCVLIHDTIPLSVPEHCAPELTRSFSEHFLALCLQIDRAIATSDRCAQDFTQWQRRYLPQLDIPVTRLPLDARLPAAPDEEEPVLPKRLRDRPFVLCVATIEQRKNHLLLLHAWLTLLRRHGHAVIPDLVLLGRRGYNSGPVLDLMRAAPELRQRVLHLEGVGDGLLALLYQRCLFTVFNSFYEGWGLPVTEALSHGKLVVAPDHTSLRQAGGSAALYFTPQSEPELVETIWNLLRDPARRAALEEAIPGRMALRSWRQVAEGLAGDLAAPAPELPAPLARLYFPMGERIGFEEPQIPDLPELPSPFRLLHQLLCEGEGWERQERWGIWITTGAARLRLPMGDPPKGDVVLTLEVTAPPGIAMPVGLRATRPNMDHPGPWMRATLGPGEARHLRLVIPPCEAGDILVEIDTSGARAPEGETRRLTLLLTGLMICAEEDRGAQIRYLSTRLGLVNATEEASGPVDPATSP